MRDCLSWACHLLLCLCTIWLVRLFFVDGFPDSDCRHCWVDLSTFHINLLFCLRSLSISANLWFWLFWVEQVVICSAWCGFSLWCHIRCWFLWYYPDHQGLIFVFRCHFLKNLSWVFYFHLVVAGSASSGCLPISLFSWWLVYRQLFCLNCGVSLSPLF